ncbi:Cytochrome P450 [Geosmithia morbida]|uniref:Cytochrome P450 n=1 Tax=Geosmithia morbida TaxID=1094350 RepID=A0A9P4Z0P3_9HYPO|nr:Cytochrome P450 [Geosmithia morbida]KAF4126548.1 Cytochrome P450 [Geosmithia morbida]
MATLSRVFSPAGLTLAATLQSTLAIKLLPSYYGSQNNLSSAAVIFLANYAMGVFFWAVIYPVLLSPLRHIPGPREVVSVGRRSLTVKEGAGGDLFADVVRKYPGQPLISLNTFRDQLMIADPALLPEILVHRCYDFTKPRKTRVFLRRVLGEGLVVAEGEQHKFLRKHSIPAFNFRHVRNLYPMMWDKAELLTTVLRKEIAGGDRNTDNADPSVVELSSWASKITLDIMGVACLGRNINAAEKSSDPLQKTYEAILEPTREKILYAVLFFVFGPTFLRLLPWRMHRIFEQLTGTLDSICAQLVQDKRRELSTEKESGEERGEHYDILSLLIKSSNFTDAVLKDQLLTFLAAGRHETTASSLTWACYLLAKHPDLQTKLREEMTENLPEHPGQCSQGDLAILLEQLPYLNGVIHETLRLYPTVPLTAREAICDTRLGDQFVPKGTMMAISIWQINRSPEFWGPSPTEFRPERWMESNGKPNQTGGMSSNYHFMTFSHGPRSCIGQGFAKAEMRCLLAAMIRSFSWELAMDESKTAPRGIITIKPEHGLNLKLTPLCS